uniref:Uncharacterized protein n=1 Tax=Anguilla anguilla TaxID=7936 RepID=A0A0E9WKQ5_ANGAN
MGNYRPCLKPYCIKGGGKKNIVANTIKCSPTFFTIIVGS